MELCCKKINNTQYEIRLIASIDKGWHLYSQRQPDDAIALPTAISFVKHPLVSLKGDVQEKGELIKQKEASLGIESWVYEEHVQFIQIIELKNKTKTSLSGNIEFQACTNEKCLPPAKFNFSIVLQE